MRDTELQRRISRDNANKNECDDGDDTDDGDDIARKDNIDSKVNSGI
jgi:hypothetical protein